MNTATTATSATPASNDGRVCLRGKGKVNVLLVKFTFNNPSRVPPGIPQKERASNFNVDQKHAAAATNPALAKFGAVREGRVDTGGKPVIDIKNGVNARLLRTSIANSSARVIDAHWFAKPDGKIVVVIQYALPGHKDYFADSKLAGPTLEGIRALGRLPWQYVQVYVNSTEATGKENGVITVNLGGLLPENSPVKNMLVTEDYNLVAVPFVAEKE